MPQDSNPRQFNPTGATKPLRQMLIYDGKYQLNIYIYDNK
jgi:hypothetical protein